MDLHEICTVQICCKHMFTPEQPEANIVNATFATIFTHVCKLNMAANVAFIMSPTDLL